MNVFGDPEDGHALVVGAKHDLLRDDDAETDALYIVILAQAGIQ